MRRWGHPGRMRTRRLLLAAIVVVGWGCDSDRKVFAPPPARLLNPDDPPFPPLPTTVVNVPMLLDISGAVELMETALPVKFGDIEKRQPIPGKRRGSFAFELRREPFRVTVKSDTFLIASTIHYQGKGWYDPPIGPEIGGSCGTKGSEPRARIVVAFRPEIDRDWKLRVHPTLRQLTPLTRTDQDQCKVSFLKFDVTGKVLEAARGAVIAELPKIAAKLAAVNIKAEFEKVWKEMQKPIRLADSVWLTLAPSGIRLGQVSGTDRMLGATVGIDAHPRIETGAMPAVAELPLPPLEEAGEATGLNLLVEGFFDYDLIGTTLTKELSGKEIQTPGGNLVIDELRVFGVGGNRVALGVRFSGTTVGQIYFVGTPQYDSATGRISVPDLDYDASTAGALVKGLAWIKADDIRNYLRSQATFPSSETIERLSDLATKGMNRELTPGISLTTSTNRTDVVRILARPEAIIVQARTSGQAALVIDDHFFEQFQQAAAGADSAKASAPPGGSDTTPSGGDGRTSNPARSDRHRPPS